jgi:HSP20 family protein
MALRLRSNPFDSFFDWEMNDPFFSAVTFPRQDRNHMTPLLTFDLIETEQDFKLLADLPGVQDVDVSLDKDVVTIKAERKHEHKVDNDKVHSIERSYGSVQRRFKVPAQADADRAEAKLENGVLTITFPKKAPVTKNESRKLTIHRGEQSETKRIA